MNYNINNSNVNHDSKNLPLKAYFLNKYDPVKESINNNINDQSLLNNLLLDTIPKYTQQKQPVKSLYSISNDLTDYNNNLYDTKPNTDTSNHNYNTETISKDINSKMSGRLQLSGSNSDDDEEFGDTSNIHNMMDRSKEEKRRISHTAAEQKRRNAIKQGYELLQSVVPSCQQTDPLISMRITRAITLEQTIDYIHEMEKEKDKHDQELDSLKKEVIALKIMKSNYEEILQFHRNQPKENSVEINDDVVFDLFVKFSDNLFQSFQQMINANSFAEMTSSTLNWLEQQCTAKNLKNLVLLSLYQVIK